MIPHKISNKYPFTLVAVLKSKFVDDARLAADDGENGLIPFPRNVRTLVMADVG